MQTDMNRSFKRLLMPLATSLLLGNFAIAIASAAYAEQRSPEEAAILDHIIVTATRSGEASFNLPFSANSVDLEDIAGKSLHRTLPEALRYTPGVLVQKTGHGQGSPFIRGFTGFRTLLLIDGIRLNNSVMRDGPNQYWNTVDSLGLSRLEVVKGPSSALYGTDAVGGTVNAITKSPDTSGETGVLKTNLYHRYAAGEHANVTYLSASSRLHDDLAVMLSGTQKNFGDLEAGGGTGEQDRTGYDESDAQLKVKYLLSPQSHLTLAYQRVDLDDAWRTHKTIHGSSWHGTTIGNEKKRVLDQERELAYLQYHNEAMNAYLDELDISLSYHRQGEQRHRVRSDDRSDKQGFKVDTAGFFIHGINNTDIGEWAFGAEYYHDDVDSFAKKYNSDGSLNSVEIQGPVADEATYDLFDLYIQNHLNLSDSLSLLLGGRYTYAELDANRVKDPNTGLEISISDEWETLTGSARMVYKFADSPKWAVFLGASQGFRAPNLSDMTRFDSARSNEIETPAQGLDPEEFLTFEVGTKFIGNRIFGQFAYYYTDIRNMIIRTPTGRIIDGDNEVTKKNAGDGFVHGLELDLTYQVSSDWSAAFVATWMEGRVDTFPTSQATLEEEPIDRMKPLSGILTVKWDDPSTNYWLEASFASADSQDKLSSRDQSDTQRIPPGGTPGYTTFGLRGGWLISDALEIFASVENISDKDYRIHGSGLNEPGRNFIVGVDLKI